MEEDDHCSNVYWAGVGGVDLYELNRLEQRLIRHIKCDVYVSPLELCSLYDVYDSDSAPHELTAPTGTGL